MKQDETYLFCDFIVIVVSQKPLSVLVILIIVRNNKY
jgi:hypothetical protein